MHLPNIIAALFVSACLCLFGAAAAVADNRVALVVGNGAYRNVPVLPNPPNDAADVGKSLERLGFVVTSASDASYDTLRRALIDFGAKARGADMAVIYFAGHGMEVAGEDWVVPVDAELKSDIDVENEAIGLKSLMLAVSSANQIGLVVLDACRNNPFGSKMQRTNRTRAVDRGLTRVEPADNVLVAFAAKDGTTATDGDGRNSPFTAALLRHIETPGLEITFLFRNVRDEVLADTHQLQQPFVYGSLSKEAVYLKPPPPNAPSSDLPDAADLAWSFIEETTDASTLQRFVDHFPASQHLADAKRRIAELNAAAVAAGQKPTATETAPVAKGSEVTPVPPAPQTLAHAFQGSTPEVEAAWNVVKATVDSAVLRRFADEFPDGKRQTIVKALDGAPGTREVLHQLRSDQMHAVLSDYGRFVQTARYGEVWTPTVTPAGWHPYEPCHWINTRRFGWYYSDPTPWGMIVHHYGRWTHDRAMGWIWVPGVDFSPGWVVWRTGAEHVGWAPMPPAQDIGTLTSAEFENADFWIFMDQGSFTNGCSQQAVPPPESTAELMKSTDYVREFRPVGGIMVAVLPATITADVVDLEPAFDPWPPEVLGEVVGSVNKVWNTTASAAGAFCPPVEPASSPGPGSVPALPARGGAGQGPSGKPPAAGIVRKPAPRAEPPKTPPDPRAVTKRPARPPPEPERPPVFRPAPPRIYKPAAPPVLRREPAPIYAPHGPPDFRPGRPGYDAPDRAPVYAPGDPGSYRPGREPVFRPRPGGYGPGRQPGPVPGGYRPGRAPDYGPRGPGGYEPGMGSRWPGGGQGGPFPGFGRDQSPYSRF